MNGWLGDFCCAAECGALCPRQTSASSRSESQSLPRSAFFEGCSYVQRKFGLQEASEDPTQLTESATWPAMQHEVCRMCTAMLRQQ